MGRRRRSRLVRENGGPPAPPRPPAPRFFHLVPRVFLRRFRDRPRRQSQILEGSQSPGTALQTRGKAGRYLSRRLEPRRLRPRIARARRSRRRESRPAHQRHARRHRRPSRRPAPIRHHGRPRPRPRGQPSSPRPARPNRRLTQLLAGNATGLAFAPFLPGLKVTPVPVIILRVRGAKPALALVAEDCSGLIARLVQAGHTFTRRLRFLDRKSTRLNSSHANNSYAVFCLKKKQHSPEIKLVLHNRCSPIIRILRMKIMHLTSTLNLDTLMPSLTQRLNPTNPYCTLTSQLD